MSVSACGSQNVGMCKLVEVRMWEWSTCRRDRMWECQNALACKKEDIECVNVSICRCEDPECINISAEHKTAMSVL